MTIENQTVRLHATVEGRVQGVGFRYFVIQNAEELNLMGWVRNLDSGDVEVTAEGNKGVLDKLLEALRRGPGSGYVANVRVDWQEASGEYKRFRIIPDC